eukprot:6173245-Pleurochrysis_carterae.AAC.1
MSRVQDLAVAYAHSNRRRRSALRTADGLRAVTAEREECVLFCGIIDILQVRVRTPPPSPLMRARFRWGCQHAQRGWWVDVGGCCRGCWCTECGGMGEREAGRWRCRVRGRDACARLGATVGVRRSEATGAS